MHEDRAYHLRPQTSCLWAENSLTTLGPCEELVVVVVVVEEKMLLLVLG
jgi:hypothetical protein